MRTYLYNRTVNSINADHTPITKSFILSFAGSKCQGINRKESFIYNAGIHYLHNFIRSSSNV